MDITIILSILISLLLIGLISGIEIGFISVNRISIELHKKQGVSSGKIWSKILENPSRFLLTLLVSLNLVLVLYGLLVGEMLDPVWQRIKTILPEASQSYLIYIRLFVVTVLSSAIILFFVFLFKALFKARGNKILTTPVITYLSQGLQAFFGGISSFLVSSGIWVLKIIFNVKINEKKEIFSRADLDRFFAQNKSISSEDNSEINQALFENALSLSEIRLRECLVPRNEIVSIPADSDIEMVKQKFIDTKLSKLVVYEDNIDNITGYIHQLGLFKNPKTVNEILLKIPVAPESMSATDLMDKFAEERKTIAWVIDEFGGTAGIVTMEDLLEEIFGDIKDEYDVVDEFFDKKIAEDEFQFNGRMELDAITQKYNLTFPDNEKAETLSGYIIQLNEGIPGENDRIIIHNYEITVLSVKDTRIESVKLKILH